MRVAIVVWDLSVSGGTQRQALELAAYLLRKGHDVELFCGYLNRMRCYPEIIGQFKVEALHSGDYSSAREHGGLARSLFYPLEPLFACEERNLASRIGDGFDIVNPHEHMVYRTGFYFKTWFKKPIVWMVNDVPSSLVLPRLNKNLKGVLRWLHFMGLGGPFGYFLERERVRMIDSSVVFDDSSVRQLNESAGVQAVKVKSGLDSSSFDFRLKRRTCAPRKLQVLAVGIFFPHRRYEDLVNAVELLVKDDYDVSLKIVGSEDYAKAYSRLIRNMVSRAGLKDRVHFLGKLEEQSLREIYAASDVFVFPNSPQTWGLAVFEAMASGTPVVVSTGAGAAGVLTHGENAMLVPPARPDRIAEALASLCGDAFLYERLSRNGRQFVEENISWEAYGMKMEQLFESAQGSSVRR